MVPLTISAVETPGSMSLFPGQRRELEALRLRFMQCAAAHAGVSEAPQNPYGYMSCSLNSLKGGYIGEYIGDYYRGY